MSGWYQSAAGCRLKASEFAMSAVTAETSSMALIWIGKARGLLSRATKIEEQKHDVP